MTRKSHKVVSFNLRFGSANDAKDSWEFRRSIFYNNISSIKPDIMGTQEGLHWQLEEILYGIGQQYKYVGCGREDGQLQGEYTALVYDSTKYDIISSNSFWLSNTPQLPSKSWDSNLNRVTTWAHMRCIHDNSEIVVYNTHLDWESCKARDNGIVLIIEHAKKWGSKPIVILGDFNCDYLSTVYKTMRVAKTTLTVLMTIKEHIMDLQVTLKGIELILFGLITNLNFYSQKLIVIMNKDAIQVITLV